MTRSMTKEIAKKRFHEDPYPPTKRQRITKTKEDSGLCLLFMMTLITFLNFVIFLIYCYIYYLEVQYPQGPHTECPLEPKITFESILTSPWECPLEPVESSLKHWLELVEF